jgi:CubicO group peptidase (beta-lactamase class C family)
MKRAAILIILMTIISLVQNVSAQKYSEAQKLSSGLDEYINKAMKEWQVPGLAVGVVKDTNIVFSRTYGYRNIEEELPVDKNTLFQIGSLTKAFTSFAMGCIVDEGNAELDKPIIEYLPAFRMKERYVTEHITIRDLLCHRSGLPRHDLVIGDSITLEKVISILPYLESSMGFREGCQYNNMMYRVVGYLIEELSGKTYEEYIKMKLLGPLEMNSTFFSLNEMEKTENFSMPYSIKDGNIVVTKSSIIFEGPDCEMLSNLEDMLKWVILNLNDGQFRNNQIISKDYISQAHTVQMAIPGPEPYPNPGESFTAGYGLGWYISVYQGHKLIRHGGSMRGFRSELYMFPNESVGIIILSNGESLLPERDWNKYTLDKYNEAINGYEMNLANQVREANSGMPPTHDLKEYTGLYSHPAYGSFEIILGESGLLAKRKSSEYILKHINFDFFRFETGGLRGTRVQFYSNLKGEINRFAAKLEWGVPPIEFIRVNTDVNLK